MINDRDSSVGNLTRGHDCNPSAGALTRVWACMSRACGVDSAKSVCGGVSGGDDSDDRYTGSVTLNGSCEMDSVADPQQWPLCRRHGLGRRTTGLTLVGSSEEFNCHVCSQESRTLGWRACWAAQSTSRALAWIARCFCNFAWASK